MNPLLMPGRILMIIMTMTMLMCQVKDSNIDNSDYGYNNQNHKNTKQ